MRPFCQIFNTCCAIQPGKGRSEAVEGVSPHFPLFLSHTAATEANKVN